MAGDTQKALLGNVLSEASRQQLEAWLVDDKVGDKRLRAGLPPSWAIGDKTGSGDHGTANMIAIIRPPGRAPLHRRGLLPPNPTRPWTSATRSTRRSAASSPRRSDGLKRVVLMDAHDDLEIPRGGCRLHRLGKRRERKARGLNRVEVEKARCVRAR